MGICPVLVETGIILCEHLQLERYSCLRKLVQNGVVIPGAFKTITLKTGNVARSCMRRLITNVKRSCAHMNIFPLRKWQTCATFKEFTSVIVLCQIHKNYHTVYFSYIICAFSNLLFLGKGAYSIFLASGGAVIPRGGGRFNLKLGPVLVRAFTVNGYQQTVN